MKTSLRKIGNSQGVLIPKPFLAKAGIIDGDHDIDIDIDLKENHIVIRKLQKLPRQGWAEASKRIVAARDDALVWPEFGNEGDKEFLW